MFNEKDLWRHMFPTAILLFIVVLTLVVIIPAAAALITVGIDTVTQVIQNWFRQVSISGESRIEGLIQLCLYLVFIVVVLKFIKKK